MSQRVAGLGQVERGRPAAGAALGFWLVVGVGMGASLGLGAAPVAAQQLLDGWQLRADRENVDLAEVQMVDMPPGFHINTGPAVILWNEEWNAAQVAGGAEISGDWRVEADIYLFDPGERREAFGLFVGGRDLTGPEQAYTYVLIRNGGEFIVKERAGAEAPTVIGWTAHEAIRSFADRADGDSSVLNQLALERRGGEVRYYVNGDEVARFDAGSLPLDGLVGLRVNHGLDVHVSRFEITF